MEKENSRLKTRYAIVAILIAAGVFFIFIFMRQPQEQDIDFCRTVWVDLHKGDQRAVKYIDWEHLKLMGKDIGAHYALAQEQQKGKEYQQAFLKGTAFGFRRYAKATGVFRNWRIYYQDPEKTVIAVDSVRPDKTSIMLFTLLKNAGEKHLISIDWGGQK